MNPIAAKAAIIAVAVALVVGFGGGWTVNGWRLAGEIQRLDGVVSTQEQSLKTLEGANKRCAAGVADVQKAVQGFISQADRRAADAAKAMAKAAEAAKGHLEAAKDAMNRPPAKPGEECDTAAKEATSYAKKRKGAR
jgi:hypothetical protein